MNKQEERDSFWINVGPESGYLGTIAEETARKNDGGISPDGERLGWGKRQDDDDIATRFPYGDPCDCGAGCECTTTPKEDCPCGDDCNCATERKRSENNDCACGDSCDCSTERNHQAKNNCNCGDNRTCADGWDCADDFAALPELGILPISEMGVPPIVPLKPERQNTNTED